MQIEKVKISQVKNNPNNPRVIKNDDFRKLVKSRSLHYPGKLINRGTTEGVYSKGQYQLRRMGLG